MEISERVQATPVRAQVDGADIWVRPDPAVSSHRVSVPPASLEDTAADAARLLRVLNEKWPRAGHRIDLEVLRTVPETLRKTEGSVMAVARFGEVIAVTEQSTKPLLGLAVDMGTTNIGVLLVDVRSGRTLASEGVENPQTVHGGDVITRIGFARSSPASAAGLRDCLVTAINEVAAELCAGQSMRPDQIADIVVVGNTVMHHMLLGLPVDALGSVPFAPVLGDALDVKARAIGIDAMPSAYVNMLPNIAGFVGSDHTAVLLAIAADSEDQTVLALDIGTNTEVTLIHQGSLSSASCPSGPALEAGHITCGMRSAPGAIESVEISDGGVRLKTIGDTSPVGICGSGVLDATAQLVRAGVIGNTGRMHDSHPRVRNHNGRREFILADEQETGGEAVVFTQADVRAVQLAKGAIRAAITVLLENAGLEESQIDQVVLAGAFGNYLNLASAVQIDLLPALPLDRFAQIGNAAGIGAKLALISYPHRAEARTIATQSSYFELASDSRFNSVFMQAMNFPIRLTWPWPPPGQAYAAS